MIISEQFSKQYEEFLDGSYDCVDRIVINAYHPFLQSPGGFRLWWRTLMGNDDKLNNTQLMKIAGRFSRRIHKYAEKQGITLKHCNPGDRKHEIAEKLIPKKSNFKGVFCILAGRAPASVWDVKKFDSGAIDIRKKVPLPYVNHYSFHIMDPEWGHITIKLCPHPPFSAQIILNGHEFVANQAKKKNISFRKEGNCFSEISNAAGFAKIADTMRAQGSVGRLVKVCERWIYSACLCFALTIDEQEKSGFRYSYSVYQVEYSRNLLFTRGRVMEEIFQSVIDRTRAPLSLKTIKTIFGYKNRPFKRSKNGKLPRIEVVVEKPVYNLTIFKIHFGKLTVKIYSKGERVLRIETVAHNTSDLRCGKVITKFPKITNSLKKILERFVSALQGINASFVDYEKFETWPRPSQVGATRVAGIDINRSRPRAVMEAVISLSVNPHGFTVSNLAEKIRDILDNPKYLSRHASYDLKKFRGKDLVNRIEGTRRYESTQDGLRLMAAFLVLRNKVLLPIMASVRRSKMDSITDNQSQIDGHYKNIQNEMNNIFELMKIAA